MNDYINGHRTKVQADWIARMPVNWDFGRADYVMHVQLDVTFQWVAWVPTRLRPQNRAERLRPIPAILTNGAYAVRVPETALIQQRACCGCGGPHEVSGADEVSRVGLALRVASRRSCFERLPRT